MAKVVIWNNQIKNGHINLNNCNHFTVLSQGLQVHLQIVLYVTVY